MFISHISNLRSFPSVCSKGKKKLPSHQVALTPKPTLPVENNSKLPLPTHSAKTQSNLKPQNCFHFRVLAGSTPANSPRSFFAREAGSSPAIPPSHRSLITWTLLDLRIRDMRWDRASWIRRRKGPVFGRASWRRYAGVSCTELLRHRPRVPPASTTAPEPPMAAREPEAAREMLEKAVERVLGIPE